MFARLHIGEDRLLAGLHIGQGKLLAGQHRGQANLLDFTENKPSCWTSWRTRQADFTKRKPSNFINLAARESVARERQFFCGPLAAFY